MKKNCGDLPTQTDWSRGSTHVTQPRDSMVAHIFQKLLSKTIKKPLNYHFKPDRGISPRLEKNIDINLDLKAFFLNFF